MRSVGIYEMRAKLGELVRAAADGEAIVIEVRGKPVARLVQYGGNDAEEAAQWLRDRASSAKAWNTTARELVIEGRH